MIRVTVAHLIKRNPAQMLWILMFVEHENDVFDKDIILLVTYPEKHNQIRRTVQQMI